MGRVTKHGLILPRAMLFDMDGTLTEPMLDFPAIKAEMGIGQRPILEALAEMDDACRAAAEAVLHRHEEHAAENSRLNPGCIELLAWLRERKIATALITRNSRLSARTVLSRHGLSFGAMVTREDGPFKPDPRPLVLACEKLSVRHDEAWMIGDGRYDVEAGAAANIPTIWISHGRPRPFDALPWREVRDLMELMQLMRMRGSSCS
jgi:HAD superfamily hydrolase (TIGR01509 family)